LEAAGSSLNNVVKTTCFMADLSQFGTFNDIYAKYFTTNPARECVQVAALPKGALIEVSAIAVA
jgi:enamine deaminase RidA (YjgF/YER057c/UK114 family)